MQINVISAPPRPPTECVSGGGARGSQKIFFGALRAPLDSGPPPEDPSLLLCSPVNS